MPLSTKKVPSAPAAKRPATVRPSTARNVLREETRKALGRYLGDDEDLKDTAKNNSTGRAQISPPVVKTSRTLGAIGTMHDLTSKDREFSRLSSELFALPSEFESELKIEQKEQEELEKIKQGASNMAFHCLRTLRQAVFSP